MAATIDKKIELTRINTRLSELDREYSKLSEEHNHCPDYHYSDEGHCGHYGRFWANAVNHVNLTEKKERLERELSYYDLRYYDSYREDDYGDWEE